MIPNACFKTDRTIQYHHRLLGRVRPVMTMMMSIQEGQEFCTGKSVSTEPCAHPETQLAGQTCNSLCRVFASPPTAECRCWRGSLLHIVCPCLLRVEGSVQGSRLKEEKEGKEVCRVCIAQRCLALRQHEVSGSPTPSATWETGGHSHTQLGMWCGCLECMIHGMLRFGEETDQSDGRNAAALV